GTDQEFAWLVVKEERTKMSRRSNGAELDLKLNLSPPRANNPQGAESPHTSVSSSEMSPEISCVLSESEENGNYMNSSSPETSTTTTTTTAINNMMLVGCPQCLMYVMLSEVDPKCPQCKSTVFISVLSIYYLAESPHKWVSSSEMSPEISCVLSESEENDNYMISSSPETSTTTTNNSNNMMLVGCPQCLMYWIPNAHNARAPPLFQSSVRKMMNNEGNDTNR
ncbi:hypothetical protein Tsubulata_036033, partial [Turnera subulata]